MDKNSGQVVAIFMAIAVPVGFWLGLEYLNRPATPVADVAPPASLAQQVPSADPPQQEEVPAPPQSAVLAAQPAPGGLYKCRRNGRTAYTDKPEQQCDNARQATRMAPVVASAGIAPYKPYQQQLAELEQERARDQARNASLEADQGNQAQRNAERAAHDQVCQGIADEVRWLDSALRQPHGAQMGDFWTEKRRKAMDRRYSEHC